MGVSHTPNLDNLPFCRVKTVVQYISEGQLTGPKTIGQLLLPNEEITDKKNYRRATSDTPPTFVEVTSILAVVFSIAFVAYQA